MNNRRGTGIAGSFLNQAVGLSEACISKSGIGEALPSADRIWKYENEFATDEDRGVSARRIVDHHRALLFG